GLPARRARPRWPAPARAAGPVPPAAAGGAPVRRARTRRSALPTLAGARVEGNHVAAQQRQLALAGQLALQAVEFLAEFGHVLERAVDRGEAHVGDVVELAQLVHHELAHAARGQFALGGHAHPVDHRAHRRLDLLLAHRALVQRTVEALPQLALIEALAAAVGLDDRRQLELDRLQRGEAFAAGLAFAPAADRGAIVAHARIDDPGVHVLAEGAMHGRRAAPGGNQP